MDGSVTRLGYTQPFDYKFSHDSIELAERVVREVRSSVELVRKWSSADFRALDLCAGCGVVGFEVLAGLRRIEKTHLGQMTTPTGLVRRFDFLEVQSLYRPYFEQNLLRRREAVERFDIGWLEMNYENLTENESGSGFGEYDLIVANPPYFDSDQGRLPPSEFKARCRFFLDSDFATLCQTVVKALSPGGFAYMLVRDLQDHSKNRTKVLDDVFSPHGQWLDLEPVRGTRLIRFVRSTYP